MYIKSQCATLLSLYDVILIRLQGTLSYCAPLLRQCFAHDQTGPGGRVPLTIETTHHYLSLLAEDVPDGATQFKCCPPVRNAKNQVSTVEKRKLCQ